MPEPSPVLALTAHLAALAGPRGERTKLHPLLSIVAIARCAVICGAESGDDIAGFGGTKAGWLASSLDRPHGVPSRDTVNRAFAALDPGQFPAGCVAWTKAVATALPAGVIAFDGKTVRGAHDRASGKAAILPVAAWASAHRPVLGPVAVDAKSNAITAIPGPLRALAIGGCLVTIAALGCQRESARQILDQGGDGVRALEENQATPHRDVAEMFAHARAGTIADRAVEDRRSVDKGHGRIEVRRARAIADGADRGAPRPRDRRCRRARPAAGAAPRAGAARHRHGRGRAPDGGERASGRRPSLLSAPLPAPAFGEAVRSHWGIENRVPWVLAVASREDQSRIRQGHAAQDFALLRRLALNLLTRQPSKRLSIKGKRLKADWDTNFLLEVLGTI